MIERALQRLLAGRTAFVIAHRLSTIQGADLIVVVEHGAIVEQGTHAELMARVAPTRPLRRLGRAHRLGFEPVGFLDAMHERGRRP